MAETLTFEYDAVNDGLTVAGVDYVKGTFRGISGPLKSGGALVVEARGGGVFQVSVPAHIVVTAQAKAVPVTPHAAPTAALTTTGSMPGPKATS